MIPIDESMLATTYRAALTKGASPDRIVIFAVHRSAPLAPEFLGDSDDGTGGPWLWYPMTTPVLVPKSAHALVVQTLDAAKPDEVTLVIVGPNGVGAENRKRPTVASA
jgi:hypothetical protein